MKLKVACTRELEPDFVSKGIMWWQKEKYSHIFFIHNDFIYHADGDGVNKIELKKYLETHVIVKSFDVELNMCEKEFEALMEGEKGKDYGESQFIGFVVPSLKKLVRNKDAKRICSELVAVVLQRYGNYYFGFDLDFVSPKDVVKQLEA